MEFHNASAPQINFFCEDINFLLKGKTMLRNWFQAAASNEGYTVAVLNFIFCSDSYLLQINKDFLQHDFYTDIITFDTGTIEKPLVISADLFLSIERIKANAFEFHKHFQDELHRVMIHGLLHLMNHSDKKKADKEMMRAKEDFYLSKLIF